jgi:predicted phosphate transport protein (TIGR00153 family)
MLSWFQAVMPKEHAYFEMFGRHAATLVKGAEALRQLLDGGERTDHWCAEIMRHEDDADVITREVLTHVGRSFITPFDREHIQTLTSTLDDAIDQMQKTAKAIMLFEQRQFTDEMRGIADIIVEAAAITVELVGLLEKLRENAARISELAMKVTALEERADHIYDEGMKALFLKSRQGDAMAYIIGSEIYDHLEKVVDRFEDVANRVSIILIEHM